MTHSSSELPTRPMQVVHKACGHQFDVYSYEWPPKIVICTHCSVPLKLVRHDKTTGQLAYRHTTS